MHRNLTIGLAALLATACPAHTPSARTTAYEQEGLAAAVDVFWQGLRWSEPESAAALLEDTRQSVEFLSTWSASPPMRITDYQVLHVEAGDPLPREEGARLRTGTSLVKVEGYATGQVVLQTEVLEQTWYRGPEQWYLDAESVPYR